jgi:hypothetical protein
MYKKIRNVFRIPLWALLTLGVLYLGILLYPSVLFANKITHGQVTVYSDHTLDSNIYNVINDALRRISYSELYTTDQKFNVFICNDSWRFWLFSFGNPNIGGIAYDNFTRDIYLRKSDVKNNRIIPPSDPSYTGPFFTFNDRPLSYYLAHEMTHIMQSRHFGRFKSYPVWLREGYADYIGKGGDFNFDENVKLWHNNAPELDPAKGLYRLYHLKVAYLLDKKQKSIKQVYMNIPNDSILTAEIMKLNYTTD